jgi:hypothetical protein
MVIEIDGIEFEIDVGDYLWKQKEYRWYLQIMLLKEL